MSCWLVDLFGVILPAPDAQTRAEFEQLLGIASEDPGKKAAFWSAYQERRSALLTANVDEYRYWNTVAARSGMNFNIEQAVAADWLLDRKENTAVLQELADQPFAVIADVPVGVSILLRRDSRFARQADALIFSCDIGILTGDERAFVVAADVMQTHTEAMVFLSSDPARLRAAEQAGLQVQLFKPEQNSLPPLP